MVWVGRGRRDGRYLVSIVFGVYGTSQKQSGDGLIQQRAH
jgi:hypothetical protein